VLGDLATTPGFQRLRIPPLSEASVHHLAGQSEIDPTTLYRQTGGNPFYIIEVLACGGDTVPISVSDAVLARASRLSKAARDVLNAAAVIGLRVDHQILMHVTGPALDEIEKCVDSGLMAASGDLLVFRHQIASDAIYAAIISPRRRDLHSRILDVVRDLPDRDCHLAQLAHHAEMAHDHASTLEFVVQAAEQAANLHAHREAAKQYARALRVADTLPPSDRACLPARIVGLRMLFDQPDCRCVFRLPGGAGYLAIFT
jgi:predicted ATPase